jgi:hypothetical protein
MAPRQSISMAELVRQIVSDEFAEDGPDPGSQARLYQKCQRLACVAAFSNDPDLVADLISLSEQDARVRTVAALAVLEAAAMTDDCTEASLNLH